jgi:DNA-binding response OmpR family regulator
MRRRTILVVNDECSARELWAQIFSEEGFKVVRARDAVEASKYLAIHRPTAAICKARLPGPDGAWVAEMIRLKGRATALVLVNGETDAELLLTVRRAIEWNAHSAPAAH